MGVRIQEFEAIWDMSRAFRQFQKADRLFTNDKTDDAVKHLEKGYELTSRALDHLEKAEEDAYKQAGKKFDEGNKYLQKSIDDYADGKDKSASRHYDDAMESYDKAFDMLD